MKKFHQKRNLDIALISTKLKETKAQEYEKVEAKILRIGNVHRMKIKQKI